MTRKSFPRPGRGAGVECPLVAVGPTREKSPEDQSRRRAATDTPSLLNKQHMRPVRRSPFSNAGTSSVRTGLL